MLRLTLHEFLSRHKLSITQLADAIADNLLEDEQTVSERYLRYLKSNQAPLTNDNQGRKPSLLMLGLIIRALRSLTKQPVSISDILEYVDDSFDSNYSYVKTGPDTQLPNLQVTIELLVPVDPLDEVWELLVQSLKQKKHVDLGLIPGTKEQTHKARPNKQLSKVSGRILLILIVFFITTGAYFSYDQLIGKPRLLAQYSRLFSFRDRVRPTSDIPVPSQIGPEGNVNQLTPTLRITAVNEAHAYEFYIENRVSNEGVYTGPVISTSFVIPDNSLCPDTNYEWRVRALGEDGWTSFSSPMRFFVTEEAVNEETAYLLDIAKVRERPELPTIVSPMSSSSSLTPKLELSFDAEVMGYGFYIRDLRTDALVYDDNFALSNVLEVPEGVLEDGGVYQWNARTRNCHYWSEFTAPQVFTVNISEP